jgi:hypothetical protein
VFFTPWGEALTRRWYRQAIHRLSWLHHVRRVAVQTNLSADLDWIRDVCSERVGLWRTYHPGEVTRSQFLQQCRRLDELSVRYSVGVVGLRGHFTEIEAIRAEIDSHVYVWVNAYKREQSYYTPDEEQFLTAIDPLFPVNNTRHASRGRLCRPGETVVSVDGDGNVRRCHFVPTVIGISTRPTSRIASNRGVAQMPLADVRSVTSTCRTLGWTTFFAMGYWSAFPRCSEMRTWSLPGLLATEVLGGLSQTCIVPVIGTA